MAFLLLHNYTDFIVSHVHPESARPSVRMQDRSGDHASGDREDGHGHLPEIGR